MRLPPHSESQASGDIQTMGSMTKVSRLWLWLWLSGAISLHAWLHLRKQPLLHSNSDSHGFNVNPSCDRSICAPLSEPERLSRNATRFAFRIRAGQRGQNHGVEACEQASKDNHGKIGRGCEPRGTSVSRIGRNEKIFFIFLGGGFVRIRRPCKPLWPVQMWYSNTRCGLNNQSKSTVQTEIRAFGTLQRWGASMNMSICLSGTKSHSSATRLFSISGF
ncbi:hypothetical protein BCV70DRAFT_17980 [Testicularia cyperi]|uniref:Uncharacterized protein n=1 Tax=Testicularia cyperi TaxID=1882483 RepID=A0A317XYV3_9BASI|nr:hypothetical protein BCV70DRAFT_17980 [Testicularia cyperi]